MSIEKYTSRTIMIITIVVALVLIIVIWPLSLIGKGETSPAASADEAELRIQPVARVEMQAAASAAPGQPRDGATIYNTVCKLCHEAGLAGAPKTGDKAAWAPRLAQGAAAMLANARNGKGAMPPKGGAVDLTETELKAAVDFLVGTSK